ncbi:DUF2975 domain-containing protein [Niabella soli]|uniref:DUF2975 domain-containing protein n=1 Tax=Niabella soli DSM 19437 TaxID=929713 RepID=W0F207_9BACT|nr:DUF2975 domain-containing protein [Niabella soli]AHF15828.1 hypothetical protein NIASO_13015 [Niabella soli DSM 19437]
MKTKQVILLLNILVWIIFVALCVEAGSILISSLVWLVMPNSSYHLFKWKALSALFGYDKGHFAAIIIVVSIVTILKAYLFYLIIKLMSNKNLKFSQPFSAEVNRLISWGSVCALFIGLFSKYGFEYAQWLSAKGISMPDAAALKLDGAEVWILMGVILFAIAQVFKRGVELQQENDLTV